jgi:aspartyl-tRNA synthetase
MLADVFKDVLDIPITIPFTRLTYSEAMDKYGLDKPDLRFGMELTDITEIVKNTEFGVFKSAVTQGGVVKAMKVEKGDRLSRKDLDDLRDFASIYGGKGVAYTRIKDDGVWQSPIAKFLAEDEKSAINEAVAARPSDVILFGADTWRIVNDVLGNLRNSLAAKLREIPHGLYNLAWITDFPMFEWNEEEARHEAMHHPFTSPREEDLDLLETDPAKVRSRAYDLVLNGSEIGGGSIRIHRTKIQSRVFKALGIGEEEAREKFGFLLEALKYGAPPHGGIAFGLDRIMAIVTGSESIRDVIAFPKTQRATCPLTGAPSGVDPRKLKELGIKITKK